MTLSKIMWALKGFRPLAGCKLFHTWKEGSSMLWGFRPLTGRKLFHRNLANRKQKGTFSSPGGA